MEARYRVTTGGLKLGFDRDEATAKLTQKFQCSPDEVEPLFSWSWRTAKRDLSLPEARKYLEVFSRSGLRTYIEPNTLAPGASVKGIVLALVLAPLPALLAMSVLGMFMSDWPLPMMFFLAVAYFYLPFLVAVLILRFIISKSALGCSLSGGALALLPAWGAWSAFPDVAIFISAAMFLIGMAGGFFFWRVGLGPWGRKAWRKPTKAG